LARGSGSAQVKAPADCYATTPMTSIP
jgi:hypothetical protein